MHLYEAHLPVANTEAAAAFYTRVVGLEFAHRDPTRDIVFLWAGVERRSMLGLWGPTTTYGRDFRKSHVAFAMTLPELRSAARSFSQRGVATFDFAGKRTSEPSIIGWMPSAQLYFEDPDGHSIEFVTLLDEEPDALFVGSLSEWRSAR
jgi:lactoylglutathione lyase